MMLIASILTLIIPVLLSVAMFTLAERTVMASMQRRFGPHVSGIGGILQPFWDVLSPYTDYHAAIKTAFKAAFKDTSNTTNGNHCYSSSVGNLNMEVVYVTALDLKQKGFFWPNVRANKRYGPHTFEFICIAVGLVLGDGHIELHGNGVRLSFAQAQSHIGFFRAVSTFLFNYGYVSKVERPELVRKPSRPGVNPQNQYQLRTYTFGSLLWLHDLFYVPTNNTTINNSNSKGYVKVLKPELAEFITPLSLAVFLCGDGSWSGSGVYFATDGFTKAEVEWLKHVLMSKFGIVASVQTGLKDSGQYRLYVNAASVPTLRTLLLPYTPPVVCGIS